MSKEISFIYKPAGYIEVNYAEFNSENEVVLRRYANYAKDRLFLFLDDITEAFTILHGSLSGVYFSKSEVLAPEGSTYSTAKECFDAICKIIHA